MSKSIDVYKIEGGRWSQAGVKGACDSLGETTKNQPYGYETQLFKIEKILHGFL
jgi:hypothetical protein